VPDRNLRIFDELVELFNARARLPGADEFPKLKPAAISEHFPHDLLGENAMAHNLCDARLEAIRQSIIAPNTWGSMVRYCAPWVPTDIEESSVDLLLSQSVLQYFDDVPSIIDQSTRWLKPDGLMSHQIDLKSIGLHEEWNGHWTYTDTQWAIVAGRRKFKINRQPCSSYVNAIQNAGLQIIRADKTTLLSTIALQNLAPKFSRLDTEDLTTANLFIQAKKPIAALGRPG
jgi:hypothetical protein